MLLINMLSTLYNKYSKRIKTFNNTNVTRGILLRQKIWSKKKSLKEIAEMYLFLILAWIGFLIGVLSMLNLYRYIGHFFFNIQHK